MLHNIWREYRGWYDGNPARSKPAPDASLAREIAQLAGGARRLAERAQALLAPGERQDLRLAGHLGELAALAAPEAPEAPEDREIHRTRAAVLDARLSAESSTIAKGIFAWAASESRSKLGDDR